MGAVKVQHVGLEAGDLETNAVILTLFGQLFVVGQMCIRDRVG